MNSELTLQLPSPIEPVSLPLYREKEVSVCIKREDLIHPHISGNKWRKLKFNIDKAIREKKGILTFGGAFSNHIYATAHTANAFRLPCIGIIRGTYVDRDNHTLASARSVGMKIELVTHDIYRQKNQVSYLKALQKKYPDYLLIPEGGNNDLAMEGIKELGDEITTGNFEADYITVSAGTASTAKGLLRSIPHASKLIVFSSLKGEFLKDEIVAEENTNWELNTDFHFGGYAKVNENLVTFINTYKEETGILLDPIYNAKMVYGLHSLLGQNRINPGSRIMIIHTGGLQGIHGHNARYKEKSSMQIK